MSATTAGDEALALVRDGALDGLSIGFQPIRPAPGIYPRAGATLERLEVRLREVSLTPWPAYPTAMVEAVRSDLRHAPITQAAALARLTLLRQGHSHDH